MVYIQYLYSIIMFIKLHSTVQFEGSLLSTQSIDIVQVSANVQERWSCI